MVQRIAQAGFHLALGARVFHVDEVDDDQAAQIAQAQLAGDFVGRFAVGAQRGLFDVAALGRTTGVHVHRHQRFGVVDHDGAARRQGDLARVGGFDLVLDLEARKQRHIVAVALHARHVAGHHVFHEGVGLVVHLVGVDQDFADVGLEVVADRADHETAFLIDQEGAGLRLRRTFDRRPQLQQVVQVPLQLFGVAADAGGAGDQAHAGGHFELIHRFAQLGAIVAFDPARHTAATRIVRHQHQVAAGQRNEGGQRGALAATFILVDLDDQFLADVQRVLDAGAARLQIRLEVDLGDFLERQEAVAIGTVVDEAGFETGFDPGDDRLVYIAFSLFLAG